MAQISPVGVRSPGRMFSLQQSLPHLPVPPLQQTLDKFLLQLEPLVSKEEMQQAREVIIASINYLKFINSMLYDLH